MTFWGQLLTAGKLCSSVSFYWPELINLLRPLPIAVDRNLVKSVDLPVGSGWQLALKRQCAKRSPFLFLGGFCITMF